MKWTRVYFIIAICGKTTDYFPSRPFLYKYGTLFYKDDHNRFTFYKNPSKLY